jgi:hypothetical protein
MMTIPEFMMAQALFLDKASEVILGLIKNPFAGSAEKADAEAKIAELMPVDHANPEAAQLDSTRFQELLDVAAAAILPVPPADEDDDPM